MPNKRNNVNNDIKALQDMIYASNYGLSRNFIERNSDIVLKSNKAVNDTLVGFGVNNITNNSNSLQELTSLVSQSIKFRGNSRGNRTSGNLLNSVLGTGDDADAITGIKHITPMGNVNSNETEIVNDFAAMYQSFMNVTSEYRGVCDIIPEVGKAIQNISRDILSVSELSGRFLNKIYKEDGNTGSISDKDKKEIEICTDLIQNEIIDKNNLEEKLKRWVYESLVCGVKPIAFIPYDYIIRQLNQINAKDANINLNVDKISDKLKSGEAYKICENKNQEKEFYHISVESSISDMFDETKLNGADREIKSEEYYDSLLTDDLVEIFANDCENDFNKSFESLNFEKNKAKDDDIRHMQIYGERSSEANEQLELLESMTKQYKDVQDKAKSQTPEERKVNARHGLRTLARFIDEHIDVVKPGASSAFIANKIMNEKDRYSKFYNLGENYLMAEGLEKKIKNKQDKGERSDIGMYSYDSDSELGKECLIVPYAPEDVIPININGEYMGFYVLEYANENGPMWNRRRHVGSFTDYIKQQGLGDDKALTSGNGASLTSYNSTDPLETSLYSPLSLYNYAITNYLDSESDTYDQRFDLMKVVTLRVLSHRLRDPDLAENKIFKDAVMTMLRNDVLTRKKVQFTFIPPEYMVYMTYKTDDDGVPKSILDGTLLWAYMYISSIMSSVMIKMLKSADKEKYEVAVGLMKHGGYTIDELQRVLSTRSIYSGNMFSSLGNVIRNSGAYQRMIIPVINDRKLYDVTQIESVNNVSPDDDFTNKLLDSILSKVYINPGMRGSMDSLDFAHEYVYKNIEYRNNIMDAQNNYEKFITRILKILANYSSLNTYNSKAENYDKNDNKKDKSGNIDIARIEVKLSISTMMSMTTVSEVLDSAKNLANSITEVFNLQDGSAVETARNTLFKKSIIEKYVNNVEWSEIEDILIKSAEEAPNEVYKSQKLAKLDQKLQEDDMNDDQAGGGDMGLGSDDFGNDSGGTGSDLDSMSDDLDM